MKETRDLAANDDYNDATRFKISDETKIRMTLYLLIIIDSSILIHEPVLQKAKIRIKHEKSWSKLLKIFPMKNANSTTMVL